MENELNKLNEDNLNYDAIKETLVTLLDTHAPMKMRLLRENDAPYMNKNLRKAIMTRSRLKNLYNKTPNVENEMNYKKQRNYCVNLFKKSLKEGIITISISEELLIAENSGRLSNRFSRKNKKSSRR